MTKKRNNMILTAQILYHVVTLVHVFYEKVRPYKVYNDPQQHATQEVQFWK